VKTIRVIAIALVAVACHKSDGGVIGPSGGGPISVAFANGAISAKIAATSAARDTGLMNVASLGANDGMLFVFGVDHSWPDGFWMKDTPIPLSIAFIDVNMRVINTDEMAANTLTPHYANAPYRYALEANQGWFTSHGVTAGALVSFTLPSGVVIDP
jgi:uncharacterized membrane protein (UPF0127 family)